MSVNMKLPDIKYTQLFINNEFVDSISGKKFSTINPTNGKVIAEISEGDKADVDKAVTAAKQALSTGSRWRKLDASSRARLMFKFADLIARDLEYIAALETLDNGKPYSAALRDIQRSIDAIRYFAGSNDKILDEHIFSLTLKEPVGVVGQIICWNYPFLILAWTWGPALAAGCTMILKPAEQTPLSALYAAALAKEAGFPPGVVNVVPGYGPTAGAAIAKHPDINRVAFTGSAEVGHLIIEASAKSNLKRVTLEVGLKSPLVIFDDVDVKEAAEIASNATFSNHGQNCSAGSHIFVHANIYDEFVSQAKQLALKRKVGDPFDSETEQGPQIDQNMFNKVLGLIKSGKEQGAVLEAGGQRQGNVGFFIKPTVFSNVTDDMRIAKEAIFAPVQYIFKFQTMDEVIERINKTKYGPGGVITKDINKGSTFAQAAKTASFWVNCYDTITPQDLFGGFKQLGIRRKLFTH